MLPFFKFHHIGVAVNDIDATASVYEQGGYHRSATIYDPIQNVNICWLTKDGSPTVELLAPQDEKSPVNKILEKNGVTPYHTCWIVSNIEDAARQLRKQRYVMVSKPGRRCRFLRLSCGILFQQSSGLD